MNWMIHLNNKKYSNNRFNRTAPFVTEFATRYARLRKLRANPLRGTGLPVKRMLGGRFAQRKKNTIVFTFFVGCDMIVPCSITMDGKNK
jgi:hypothetical protein